MKEIKLTQNKTTLVDDNIFEYLNQWNWYAAKMGNTFYALRGGKWINGKRKSIKIHRVILEELENNNGNHIDHIDHNGLNNQKLNLRICSNSENQMNRRSSGLSQYLGVGVISGKYFSANIRIDKKLTYLGCFKTEKEAALKYNEAAIIHHGKFANLNII